MKNSTSEAFNLVKLHDCVVKRFVLTSSDIYMGFNFAYLEGDNPDNPHSVAKIIKPCELKFREVTETEFFYYISEEEGERQRADRICLDPFTILRADIQRNRITSEGDFYLEGVPADGSWMEWTIQAESSELRWNRFDGDAWYV